MSTSNKTHPQLIWESQDVEQRCFFKGGKHTRVNSLASALLGLFLAVIFFGILIALPEDGFAGNFASLFLKQGPIPYFIVFFAAWSLGILFIKSRKLKYQKKALAHRIIPKETDFILSAGTVDQVVDKIYQVVDEPKNFLLFNRIEIALSNLKNLGQVGDVGDILINQGNQDEVSLDTSYSLVNGFIWAIPVLGFIGTVLGLSSAIGGFGEVLETAEDIQQIKNELKSVTSGLSMAFVTTLQALTAALVLQLLLTFLKKNEEEFLEESSKYCTRNIVNRLRIMPFEQSAN